MLERAIIKGLLASSVQTRNMFVCNMTVAGGDNDRTAWGEYLQGVYGPLQAFISSVFTTTSIEIQHRNGSSWETVDEDDFQIPGQATGDALANLVAGVLIGKTGGLRGIGRKFFSGWAESAASGNSLGASALAALGTSLIGWITPFTTTAGSYLLPGIIDKSGNFREFIGGSVSSLLGTMRRRKPGLGI